MNVAPRGVDVGDHLVDCDIAVGGEGDAVPAGRLQAVDCLGERERRVLRAAPELLKARFVTRRPRQPRIDLAPALPPAGTDARLAEQQVGEYPDDRQDEDDDDPREPRRGFAMGPDQGAQEDGKLRGNEEDLGSAGEGELGNQPRLSPTR
jgi:hypothetical protein